MIYSVNATFIILHKTSVSLHFSIVIMIIKNCLGCCSGGNSPLCYFPLAMIKDFQEVCIFLAGAMGSMILKFVCICVHMLSTDSSVSGFQASGQQVSRVVQAPTISIINSCKN